MIRSIVSRDRRFVEIYPYTTRPLRAGEGGKIHVSKAEFSYIEEKGGFAAVNNMFGNLYGTPLQPILKALSINQLPILEYTITNIDRLRKALPRSKLTCAYILPESIDLVITRVKAENRDHPEERIAEVRTELKNVESGSFDSLIDFKIINEEGNLNGTAERVKTSFIRLINK